MTHGICAATSPLHEPLLFGPGGGDLRSPEGTQVAEAEELSDALGSVDESA